MIPGWLRETERFVPARDGSAFAVRTLRGLGS